MSQRELPPELVDAEGHRRRWDQVHARALSDRAFRMRLKENPRETLRSEGIDVPDDVRVTVVEFDPKHRYLFLPPSDAGPEGEYVSD